ncbi:MAG: NAD(P)-dependent oxidoreductase [Verrucomicrobia bacterium]|nr:NAD(P)-dependent oxidoreductase [Verrucomicrobiota bacterium]
MAAENDAVGLIGVGLLGSAIAERLSTKGYDLYGCDPINPDLANISFCSSAADLIKKCDRVIFCLPTSNDVSEVLHEQGDLLESDRHVIIDTTTGDPEEMNRLADSLSQKSVPYIEANVAGSSAQLRKGEAVLFLGGSKEVIARYQQLFDDLANRSFHLGGAGSASRFKLIHNLILGLNRAVLAEGLAFAEALGFDLERTLSVIQETPAASEVMLTKGPRMVAGDFESPQARLSQHLKDVRLILKLASSKGAKTPLSELHQSLLEGLENKGLGSQDNSAIIEAFRESERLQ